MTSDHPPPADAVSADKPKPVFLIARPRSGTTVFGKMLQTHPKVVSIGEIFNEANPVSYFAFLQRQFTTSPDSILPSRSNRLFLDYVDSCRTTALESNPRCRSVILDVKYDQAHLLCEPWLRVGRLPRLYFLVREKKWKVIDIHRRDPFRLNISNQIAIQSQIYHSSALEPGQKQTTKVHINAERLVEEVRATQDAYDAVARHFRGYGLYKQIFYEDMFADDDGTTFSNSLVADLAKFLNVGNAFDRTPKLQKLLQQDIFSYIKNAAQIRTLMDSYSCDGQASATHAVSEASEPLGADCRSWNSAAKE